jgi:hypothetical protein
MRKTLLPVLAVSALFAVPAAAQMLPAGMGGEGGIPNPAAPSGAAASKGIRRESDTSQPSSLPGARARPDSVIPLKGGVNDLPPTDALFDAINRGDILTARDAISRGADLDATNLLGLTPIELSVDLGRNDISFLLLSLRGASGSAQAAKQPGEAAPPPSMTAAQKREAGRPTRVSAGRAPANIPVAQASPRAPALFAGNGGAAVPSAGFLGFDHH